MNRSSDGVYACPYCGRPLHWVSLRWFGRGCFECERCGEFPDLGDASSRSARAATLAEQTSPRIPQKQAGRPRVLLVDDSVEHRDLYALMLEGTATVITASRGEDALAIARAEALDAVILDVLMPGMDGWTVAERLKASPLTSSIPVIMLTSLDGLDVPERAQRVGASAVIMKPCPVERLAIAITEAVEARQKGLFRSTNGSRVRRWTRKPVGISVTARVNTLPAHVVNISYGGLCVEIESAARAMPSPVEVSFPASHLSISAGVVWMFRGDCTCLCGAEVVSVSDEWLGLVDTVSV